MRYLIRLKNDPIKANLNFAHARLGTENRLEQWQAIQPRDEQLSLRAAMMENLAPFDVHVVASPMDKTQMSGIAVVECSDVSAMKEFSTRYSDYKVIEDKPISLIRPDRVARTDSPPDHLDTWHLDRIFLGQRSSSGGEGITVGVLDTGVTEVAEIGGKVSGHNELNFDNWTVTPTAPGDTDGHGTHVAGLICGDNVGVAPGARVQSVTMIPGGHGSVSNFVLAMEWVRDNPEIAIMNMSAGIPGYVDDMRGVVEILENVGVLMVIATGNEGPNKSRSPGNYVEPLSIVASTREDRIAGFSSGGTMFVDNMSYPIPDLVAPGQEITSCVMDGGYEAWNGTSMATPIVSGVAALHIEKEPDILLTVLKEKIILSCVDLGFPVTRQGAGLVQFEG